MNLNKIIKENLERMNHELREDDRYWKTSSGNMLFYEEFRTLLPKYCKGKVLDAGAGHLLYKSLLLKHSNVYESMDFQKTDSELTYVADIQDMPSIKSRNYDFVFSRNVLEHVPYPEKAFHEIARVMKDGAHGVITVPFLGYLHNEPYDFWRFTKYSLARLSQDAGLEVIEIRETGGLISFLSYIFQTIFLGLTYRIPLFGKVAFWINYVFQKIALLLDRYIGMKKILPLDYILVVKK
jgi:SAM-dependent methyltransferase